MPITQLSLAVVGADYLNKNGSNRRSEILMSSPGETVELRLEPKNPVDPSAVAVFSARGAQIGYLTAERCGWIGGMIKAGRPVRAVFQQEVENGAIIRVALDGETPQLPSPKRATEEANSDNDFWPDPEPPEDWEGL